MPLFRIHSGYGDSPGFERSPRITLETDAPSVERVPASVRAAADSVTTGALGIWPSGKLPENTDGSITWLAGDQLLSGSPASLRYALRFPGRRSFVPVHLPGIEEMPLLALQPRLFSGGPPHDYWDFSTRIENSIQAPAHVLAALRASREPWANLSLALLRASENPGEAVDGLQRLWSARRNLHFLFAALAVRNLVLLLVRHGESARAEQFLVEGLQAYPNCGELAYLAGWLRLRENRAALAVPFLERARAGDRNFLGCGGENSYRADWLMGLVALRVGNERMAFDRFCSGLLANPVFSPAVEQMLRLRLPPRLVAAHETEFQQAAWRKPALFEKIFDFLLRHRAFEAAAELLEPALFRPNAARTHEELRDRLRVCAAPFQARNEADANASPGILLSGPFFEHTSLGRINREIAANASSNPRWSVRLEPSAAACGFPHLFCNGELLDSAVLRPLTHLDLTVRHQWPPDFRRPSAGKLAIILPWEYGAIPRVWVREIEKNVDEVWVPSHFVRGVLQRSGVSRTPIEVIPNGFDPSVFMPEGPTSRPHGCRKFAFLFVGGAIRRKGIDLLLDAYRIAFDAGEDVTLIAHISGLAGSYRHNSLIRRLQEMAADPRAPHVQIVSDSLDDPALAGLYRGCDVFVLPFRGEGFGMPLLEALACAKPVITTAVGPARDFCDATNAYFIPAREALVPDDPPPLGEFAGKFTWFEPELGELARLLRHCYEHRDETIVRGKAGAAAVRKRLTWERVMRLYSARIADLAEAKNAQVATEVSRT